MNRETEWRKEDGDDFRRRITGRETKRRRGRASCRALQTGR
jgi:hypothetical protein